MFKINESYGTIKKLVCVIFLTICITACPSVLEDAEETIVKNATAPVFSIERGIYNSEFTVSMSCLTANASIYYKTSSMDPADTYNLYVNPVTVNEHLTIWADAECEGFGRSSTSRVDYSIIPSGAANLLGNGDFSGAMALWADWVNPETDASASFNYMNDNAEVIISGAGIDPWNISLRHMVPPILENGKIYTLSFEASATTSRTLFVKIAEGQRDLNNNGVMWDDYSPLYPGYELDTTTRTYVTEFVMNNPTDDFADISFYLGKAMGNVTIDNVSLTVREPQFIDPDSIPDENLRNLLIEKCEVTDFNELTEVDLWNITELHARECYITSLEGIDTLVNLFGLYITDNGAVINDFSPLCLLSKLEYLSITDTGLDDLSFLSACNDLKYLSIRDNPGLDDISTLSSFDELTVLDFNNTAVSTLIPIQNLTGLKELQLGGTNVSDLSPISGLVNLEDELDFSRNSGIDNVDFAVVANFPLLKHLAMGDISVSDISAMATLTHLQELHMENLPVIDISVLGTLLDAGAFSPAEDSVVVLDGCLNLNSEANSIIARFEIAGIDISY